MNIVNFKEKTKDIKASIGDVFPHSPTIYGVPYGGIRYIVNITVSFDEYVKLFYDVEGRI